MKSSSLQLENIKPTYLEQMESWVHKYPAVIKVVKIAGLILGIGLLIAPFLIAGFGIPASTCFVITGGGFNNSCCKTRKSSSKLTTKKISTLKSI